MQERETKLIGVSIVSYNEDGVPLTAAFQPAEYIINRGEIGRLLTKPAMTPEQAIADAESVMASWFQSTEEIETIDRETAKIETHVITCTKWDNGTPRTCELAFYLVPVVPRALTGVR